MSPGRIPKTFETGLKYDIVGIILSLVILYFVINIRFSSSLNTECFGTKECFKILNCNLAILIILT